MRNDSSAIEKEQQPPVNGMMLLVTDNFGGGISRATVSVFTSKVLAASKDTSGAFRVLRTDDQGKVSLFNIAKGSYYVNAIKAVDTLVYEKLLRQVEVPASGIVPDTLIVDLQSD